MKLVKIKSSVYKRVLGVFGAAGFLFTFQACYGTPQNFCDISGSVNDKETGEGIPGLQVRVYSAADSVTLVTDADGKFNQSIAAFDEINVKIIDVDENANNSYPDFDTVLNNGDHDITINIQKN